MAGSLLIAGKLEDWEGHTNGVNMNESMMNVSNRIGSELDRYGSDEAIWWVHHELRNSLNALGLCVRVLESNPPDREAREYAKFISEASDKIERLVAKLRPSHVL